MLDDATDPWGVKVERVEVKDVRLPVQLQRAMAAEAEATREARAKVKFILNWYHIYMCDILVSLLFF
ncbi:SPFH domain / Band 7 family protein,putative [Schistosoma mansoni]|uniref:SPFH domain / Band 7 family protein,putative n=1 Tax=Schistosoma mansoni TaxID=6183 RepID=UPI00022C8576|nr:SPFH domain / Band 7 family protein,putative [Schistosoma mansoni]|eukprot:XP_018646191.1 SPFH domain / Band 7 family protein,putative [Schistosoma mansoni]